MPYSLIKIDTCTTPEPPSKHIYHQTPICQFDSLKKQIHETSYHHVKLGFLTLFIRMDDKEEGIGIEHIGSRHHFIISSKPQAMANSIF